MKQEKFTALIHKYFGVTAVYCAIMMTVLDGTIINIALPHLCRTFNVTSSSSVLIVNIYQMTITLLLLPFASLGDRYGYRKVFLIGTVIFTAGSLGCALSSGFPQLVAMRIVQAIGAAAVMSVNIALVRMIFPPEKLGRGLGANAMIVSLSTVAGPTLAGAVLSIASWQWLFIIHLPLGTAAFIIGKRLLPGNPPSEGRKEPFDKISALACALLLWLVINLIQSFSAHPGYIATASKMVLCIIVGWYLVRRQLRFSNPLLPVDLLRIPLFSMSIVISIASFMANMLAMVSLPFYLTSLGYDALRTGLLFSPWPIGILITAPIAGRLVERFHGGLLGAIGMTIFAAGFLLLVTMPSSGSEADIAWRMLVCGIGFGLFQTPNNVTIASSAPRNRSGAAGGMQGAGRVLGQTIGASLAAIILQNYKGIEAGHAALWTAMGIALAAAVGSSLRLTQRNPFRVN